MKDSLLPEVKVSRTERQMNFYCRREFERISIACGAYRIEVTNSYNVSVSVDGESCKLVWGDLDEFGFIINVDKTKIRITNDWLGVYRVYFSKEPNKLFLSSNFAHIEKDRVIDLENFDVFCAVGYSPRGTTPFRGIYLQEDNQCISIDLKSHNVETRKVDDDISLIQCDYTSIESKMQKYFAALPTATHHNILPLSGGLDSRYILYHLLKTEKRTNITAASYGVSPIQRLSYEVSRAKRICKTLNVKHTFIPINHEYELLDQWYRIMGPTVHCHGMYHLEFYNKLKSNKRQLVLSGAVGDAWTGKHRILSSDPVEKFFLSHGMVSDYRTSITNKQLSEKLNSIVQRNSMDRLNLIEMIRLKMVLLRYLVLVPLSLGFEVSAPFFKKDIVQAMLSLPEKQWFERVWQVQLLDNWMPNVDVKARFYSRGNTSKYRAYLNIKPSNIQLLDGIDIDFRQSCSGLSSHKLIKLWRLLSQRNECEKTVMNYLHYYPINNAEKHLY